MITMRITASIMMTVAALRTTKRTVADYPVEGFPLTAGSLSLMRMVGFPAVSVQPVHPRVEGECGNQKEECDRQEPYDHPAQGAEKIVGALR